MPRFDGIASRVEVYLRHFFGSPPRVEVIHHHLAHLASAYYACELEGAVAVSYDAWGDRVSTAVATARAGSLHIIDTKERDQSLGLFYGTMTSYLGFRAGEDEYKVMGLAAYGDDEYDLTEFLAPEQDGFVVDTAFVRRDFDACTDFEPLYRLRLVDLLGPPRRPGDPITKRHKSIARATQAAFETGICSLVRGVCQRAGTRSICLAGGGALNCAANLAIARLPEIDHVFVQPAASDRGLSLGCALWGSAAAGDTVAPMQTALLGRSYDADAIRRACALSGLRPVEMPDPASAVADLLVAGRIVGWHDGRSEFGPRALSARSILADPRSTAMRHHVNARVKLREEFRPFAPAVGAWRAGEMLEMEEPSPYMTVAHPVRDEWRARLGAVTHVKCPVHTHRCRPSTGKTVYAVAGEGMDTGMAAGGVTMVIDFASMSSASRAWLTASLTLCPASTSELALNSKMIVAWNFTPPPRT